MDQDFNQLRAFARKITKLIEEARPMEDAIPDAIPEIAEAITHLERARGVIFFASERV